MTGDSEDDVRRLLDHTITTLGAPSTWRNPPGYPTSLALCLLDSIWSLGSNYTDHVEPILQRYRDFRRAECGEPSQDNASDLLRVFKKVGGPNGFASQIGNQQRVYSRKSAPLKAEAVQEAAQRLTSEGVDSVADLRTAVAEPHSNLKQAWRQIPGQRSSWTGWRYLLLLAGDEHVKPDRMVRRFVAAALDVPVPQVSDERAAALVTAVARQRGVSLRVLDHAIYRLQSDQARQSRRKR